MSIQWGIVGAAGIATRSVIPAILSVPGHSVKAIGSRRMETAQAAAQPFGCEAEASYEALLAREDINAVYIPLPTGMHYEWVTKALQAGKHVLVEKAAAEDTAQAEAMIGIARERGLAVVENFQFTRHSQHVAIKDMIANGAIGSVRSFRASFGFPPFDEETNIRYKAELGGGALLDAGAYTLRASSFMLGEGLSVKAARLIKNEKHGVDWFGGAFLQQSGTGLFSEVAFGFDNYYQCNYEVWGSKGKLTATRAYTAKADFSPTVILEQGGKSEELKLAPDDHFRNMIADFGNIVAEGRPEGEWEHIRVQAKLIEELRKAAQV
jgi:NDP-hexose-3-ketoreductase